MQKNIKLTKNQAKKVSGKKVSDLFMLLAYLKNYRLQISLVLIALLTTSVAVLFIGKIIKYLIDFNVNSNGTSINQTIWGFILTVIILAVAGYFRSSIINEVGEKVVAQIREKVYRHVISVSAEFFENTKIGDVISRLTVDTTLLYNIISNVVSFLLRNILLFFGGIIFLFITSPYLTLISILIIILSIFPIIIIGKKVKKLSLRSQQEIGNLSSFIEESINGIKTIQAYRNEKTESQNFNNLSQVALNISIKKIKIRALLISLIIIIAFSFVGTVILLGLSEVGSGKMTAGDLSSFIFYAVITATSLVSISQVMGQLQTASGAAKRIFDLLEIESPVKELKNPTKLPENVSLGKNLSLNFKNVNFSYPGRKNIQIIKNFNLKIKNNEKIAIVGPSGSGKTTIFQLLMRFFDVNKGEILINSKFDIKKLSLDELRGLFSYISQDCFIFSGTILENIAFGKDVNKKELTNLIKSNKAFDFINKLPKKLNVKVGQKGIQLSGGERQRIAILRAIIHNTPILLLDEATSALDNKNEKLITDLIEKLMSDKIVIFIAHNLSTIRNVDKIIFMKDGEIIEQGSHEDLMKKSGEYKNMVLKDDF